MKFLRTSLKIIIEAFKSPFTDSVITEERPMTCYGKSEYKTSNAVGGSGNVDEETKNRRAEDKMKFFNDLVGAAEIVVLAKKQRYLEDTVKEHETQFKSFKFECSLWGQFLNLSIARDMGQTGSLEPVVYYSMAINLMNVKAINFFPGHGPDLNWTVKYYVNYNHNPKNITVIEQLESLPYRYIINDTSKGGHNNNGYHSDLFAKRTTPNFPRYAADDRIVFFGTDLELHVPFGRGQEVFKKIMACTKIKKPKK